MKEATKLSPKGENGEETNKVSDVSLEEDRTGWYPLPEDVEIPDWKVHFVDRLKCGRCKCSSVQEFRDSGHMRIDTSVEPDTEFEMTSLIVCTKCNMILASETLYLEKKGDS